MVRIFVCGRIPSKNHGWVNIRPRMNTLSKPWMGRASIRPWNKYPPLKSMMERIFVCGTNTPSTLNMGRIIVRGTNTLSRTWGEASIRPWNEHPVNMGEYSSAWINTLSVGLIFDNVRRQIAQAGSRYRKELDLVHRAPFVSVVSFFRSDSRGIKRWRSYCTSSDGKNNNSEIIILIIRTITCKYSNRFRELIDIRKIYSRNLFVFIRGECKDDVMIALL